MTGVRQGSGEKKQDKRARINFRPSSEIRNSDIHKVVEGLRNSGQRDD
jgi:hypothetical protein